MVTLGVIGEIGKQNMNERQKFLDRIRDLKNDLEAEIAHRLIDEGYLYEEPVICDKNHGSILYYELIYCPT